MRILIAPDKFKGSLGARDVAENIAAGLREVLPGAQIDSLPVADGGEGTAEVICDALQGSWRKCNARDPLGREIECRYAYIDSSKLAVVEMSEAAGMRRVERERVDLARANTFGVGEMLLHAARHGADEIIVGLGGSATNDAGFGMARALGFRFFEHEQEVRENVSELVKLSRIEKARNLSLPKIVGAADVRNPLLGEEGATRVFGPQKGATPDQLEALERALETLADVLARDLNRDFRDIPGAGAAGGLGFGLLSFCGATMRSGFDLVAEQIKLEERIQKADVVVTGEGCLDRQTLAGKTTAGVARLARRHGKPVFAIVGGASEDRQVREIFDSVYELGGSIPQARELLRAKARELVERDLRARC
jgi:glycerate kinase